MRLSAATPASERGLAFRWRMAQPIALALSVAMGLLSGWMFGQSNLSLAWMLFLFGFIWVLMFSLALGMWISYRTRLVRGDWRAALHVGFASTFPLATVYFAAVALLTFAIPLVAVPVPSGAKVLSRPDFLRHFPVMYACSLIVGVLSGPVFALWSPWRGTAVDRKLPNVDNG